MALPTTTSHKMASVQPVLAEQWSASSASESKTATTDLSSSSSPSSRNPFVPEHESDVERQRREALQEATALHDEAKAAHGVAAAAAASADSAMEKELTKLAGADKESRKALDRSEEAKERLERRAAEAEKARDRAKARIDKELRSIEVRALKLRNLKADIVDDPTLAGGCTHCVCCPCFYYLFCHCCTSMGRVHRAAHKHRTAHYRHRKAERKVESAATKEAKSRKKLGGIADFHESPAMAEKKGAAVAAREKKDAAERTLEAAAGKWKAASRAIGMFQGAAALDAAASGSSNGGAGGGGEGIEGGGGDGVGREGRDGGGGVGGEDTVGSDVVPYASPIDPRELMRSGLEDAPRDVERMEEDTRDARIDHMSRELPELARAAGVGGSGSGPGGGGSEGPGSSGDSKGVAVETGAAGSTGGASRGRGGGGDVGEEKGDVVQQERPQPQSQQPPQQPPQQEQEQAPVVPPRSDVEGGVDRSRFGGFGGESPSEQQSEQRDAEDKRIAVEGKVEGKVATVEAYLVKPGKSYLI